MPTTQRLREAGADASLRAQADGRTFQKLVMLQPPSTYEQHIEVMLGKLAALQPAMQFLAAAFGGKPLHRTTASTALQVRLHCASRLHHLIAATEVTCITCCCLSLLPFASGQSELR